MRSLAIIGTCAALSVGLAAGVVPEDSSAQTSQSQAKAMWESISGNWNQAKGAVKEQWGKLTDDDLFEIEGRRDQLVGKIQARYGIAKEEAEAQVGKWEMARKH